MRQGHSSLRTGDKVEIISGKDKGRVGKILRIDISTERAIVERLNMMTKHQKPMDASQVGQRIEKEAFLHISNLMLICPDCSETVRCSNKFLEDGKKVRKCNHCGATIVPVKNK